MFGIVGNLIISYSILGKDYVEEIDLHGIERFRLRNVDDCEFIIDEINFIEDTVYGVTLLINGNENEVILVSGNSAVDFAIEQYNLKGKISLSFV